MAYLPFDGDADGALISSTADTNAFFAALAGGRLLAPGQLAEMRRTVAVPGDPDTAERQIRATTGLIDHALCDARGAANGAVRG